MEALTIGALAQHAGVGVETVRFYERRGLVRRPPRPRIGYRTYPEDTVGRIRFIRNAQALGFTLLEIISLLQLRVTAGTSCAAVRARAAAKLADVEQRMANLNRIRGALQKLVAACPGRGALTSCTILEILDSPAESIPLKRQSNSKRLKKGSVSMKSLELKIEGMQCDGCAGTIQSILAREPGVKSANVSFPNRTASIFYDTQDTDFARLKAAIEKAGFTARKAEI